MVDFKILSNKIKEVGKKKLKKREITIAHDNNTPLNQKDVKEITKKLEEKFEKKYKRKAKITVRGLSVLGVMTLKSYKGNAEDMYENEQDYLKGRVKETTKFKKYTEVEFTIF